MTFKTLLKPLFTLIIWVLFYPQKWYYTWLLERLVIKANRLSKQENRKYIVTRMGGKPMLYTKTELKDAISRRKFKKGVTINEVEQHAYYITAPGKTIAPTAVRIGNKK